MTKHALVSFTTILAGWGAAGCSSSNSNGDGGSSGWVLTSPAFADGAALPTSATCEGKAFGTGESPEFDWTSGPSGTQSYALVFKDLSILAMDAAATLDHAYHWAIWDIPASVHQLPANLSGAEFPTDVPGARQWSSVNPFGYLGACPNPVPPDADAGAAPPPVTDNYSFTLYAINVPILAYPPDPSAGDNYVHPLDDYLLGHNIGTTLLHATSNAAATSFTPPAAPPGPSPRGGDGSAGN